MIHHWNVLVISYILKDSQAKFLLSLPELVGGIKTNSIILYINDLALNGVYCRPRVSSNNLIYAIYTSGTTGKPKGTLLEHRGVVNYVNFLIRDNNLNLESIGSKFAGFGFDASVIEMYPLLLCGGKLCLIPDEDKLDPQKVNKFFIEHQVSYAFLPTQFAELFFELENNILQNMLVGGDKLRKYINKPYAIKNAYGPTEITVESNQFTVDKLYDNIPIGKPLSNYSCYVVNKYMQLLPVGVVGELLIGGDGIARGYLNQPKLTAEKFINNPFQSDVEKIHCYNDRIYKTGDLVCWTSDGNLEYIGRNDFQVKIRGYRIELGEIENRIQAIFGIEQVLVVALDDSNRNKYLCAYYTGDKYSSNEFISHLNINLAAYMIPEHFIWIEKFPINVNGKIDRKLLPTPDLSQLRNNYHAPSCDEERLICDEFANVLGLEKVGIDDDFYRLGGNSIKTIWLVSRLQANFKINVSDVFKYKTPKELAKHTLFVKNNLRARLEKIKTSIASSHLEQDIAVKLNDKHQNYLKQLESIRETFSLKNIEQVVLTGATGYLGSNLLYQLLKTSTYKVVILIRAKNDTDGLNRIKAKFNYYFDEDLSIYENRLIVYCADIGAPFLGLQSANYNMLRNNTDMVIHSAALVKHYGEYDEFYQANVHSTKNLLEFCKYSKGKDFHYVSTYSVLEDGYVPEHDILFADENVLGDEFISRTNVYVQTKYEGEAITRAYRACGVNSNIYRVGNLSMISFNSRNQENIDDNGFYTRIKAMLNLGITASEIATLEVSPVDITALAIIKLASQKELTNQIFHVYNSKQVDLSSFFANNPALKVNRLSIDEFIDYLINKIDFATYRNYIEMFMLHQGWLQEELNTPSTKVLLVQNRTNKILSYLNVTWPEIDVELFSDLINQAFKERAEFLGGYLTKDKLPNDALLELAKISSLVHYDAGQILLSQGQRDGSLKLIMSGCVDNYIKSIGGWASELQLMAEGDFVNFESLNSEGSSSAYEAIFDAVSTIEIYGHDFYPIAEKYPKLYQAIFAKMLFDKNTLQQMYSCLK